MHPNKDRCPRFLNWRARRKHWDTHEKIKLLPRGIPNPDFKPAMKTALLRKVDAVSEIMR
jgi:hypothetical protein